MLTISASALRNNIYRLLDRIGETGEPLIVERKGHRLKIELEDRPEKLSRLVRHDCIKGNPEDLVHLDWTEE